MNKQAGTDWTP